MTNRNRYLELKGKLLELKNMPDLDPVLDAILKVLLELIEDKINE